MIDYEDKLNRWFLIILAVVAVVLSIYFIKVIKKADKEAQTTIQRTLDTQEEKNQ